MDEEQNALPWRSYKDYYFISKDDFDKLGANSCFRVRCKLCLPALKTIGTNRSSSSNLRKHMKCIHPEVLEDMEQRLATEGNRLKGRRKGEVIKQEEASWKRAKSHELLGGERELLFQLVEEFTAAIECNPDDDETVSQKRFLWKNLASTFNQISGGPERTPEQLKSIWESLNGESRDCGRNSSMGPRTLTSCSMKEQRRESEPYSEGVIWDSTMTSDDPDIELVDDVSSQVIVTDENGEYTSMEVRYQDDLASRPNGFKQGSSSKTLDFKKRSEIDLKLREQVASDQRVRMDGLKQQMDLKKEILKEELEHQRRMKKMELVHMKLLNSMERTMKQEAFRAEERRKEEKHAVEMSILRMSARLSPQMRWKTPGIFRNLFSPGTRQESPTSKCMKNSAKRQTDDQSSSPGSEQLPKASSVEKKIILVQHNQEEESYEVVQTQGNETLQDIPQQLRMQVDVTEK